jgi:hypothetical protein
MLPGQINSGVRRAAANLRSCLSGGWIGWFPTDRARRPVCIGSASHLAGFASRW